MRTVMVDVSELERVKHALDPKVAAALEELRAGHKRNLRAVVARGVGEVVLVVALFAAAFGVTSAVVHRVKGCDGGAFVCSQR